MSAPSRLASAFPELVECFLRAPVSKQRRAALVAIEIAASRAGLEGDEVNVALETLRRGEQADVALRDQLEALVSYLDDRYLRLDEGGDDAAKAEALRLFSRARAAAALAHAFSDDVGELQEVVYEAINALDEPSEIVREVKRALQ